MRCYIVDAFSDTPFCGNPAAICVLEDFLEDTLMQKIAIEHNLSETAFIVKQDSGDCALRWFTPAKEIDLCRHATLASAFVVMNIIESHAKAVHFHTKSGILKVIKNGSLFEMDFPSFQLTPISVTQEMSEAIGYMPQKAYLGRDSVCILDENQVINATPDIAKVANMILLAAPLHQSTAWQKTLYVEVGIVILCRCGVRFLIGQKSLPTKLQNVVGCCIVNIKKSG